jgi:glycosyltransferase involved in cell wall biosynthesis
MRVGIDASNLRAGGGVTHLVELLRAADPSEHGFDHVIVWGGTRTLAKIEPRDWLTKTPVTLLDRPLPYRVYWQRFKLKNVATEAGCDVMLVPGGSDASGFKPMVTMSRNMLPFEWKELRRYGVSWTGLKLVLLRLTQSRTFRTADGLIFLTRYAHEAVLKVIGNVAGRVVIVHHGIGDRFFQAPRGQRRPEEFTNAQPCRIIYVSIIDVYKHQWRVVEAVGRLRAAGVPIALDLIGPPGPGLKRLRRALDQIDPDGTFIRYRGAVPHEELHDYYRAADINVFASSCENMPNILLEGMAAGLPVACARSGPMPEVLGDAGVYFDPENSGEIASALERFIESPDMRADKALAAYRRARSFSWARCARETFHFLAQVRRKPKAAPTL